MRDKEKQQILEDAEFFCDDPLELENLAWELENCQSSEKEYWIRCRDCAHLKPHSSLPYCTWHGAFLEPHLLSQAWQCEGYKPKKRS